VIFLIWAARATLLSPGGAAHRAVWATSSTAFMVLLVGSVGLSLNNSRLFWFLLGITAATHMLSPSRRRGTERAGADEEQAGADEGRSAAIATQPLGRPLAATARRAPSTTGTAAADPAPPATSPSTPASPSARRFEPFPSPGGPR
jgi:hypothetical protein